MDNPRWPSGIKSMFNEDKRDHTVVETRTPFESIALRTDTREQFKAINHLKIRYCSSFFDARAYKAPVCISLLSIQRSPRKCLQKPVFPFLCFLVNKILSMYATGLTFNIRLSYARLLVHELRKLE